jgi:hypothetical protein
MGHVPINPALIQAHSTDFRKNLCEIKSKYYFCSAFHTDRRVLLVITGIFYAHTIRFCTPVWCVNAPTAYQVECNGKGRTVFNFCLN